MTFRLKNKFLDLGTCTFQLSRSGPSWVQHLLFGGLKKPSDDWTKSPGFDRGSTQTNAQCSLDDLLRPKFSVPQRITTDNRPMASRKDDQVEEFSARQKIN
ncbi:hypothetical protein DMENIID0001_070740 [Sergentomyia squamirostris]